MFRRSRERAHPIGNAHSQRPEHLHQATRKGGSRTAAPGVRGGTRGKVRKASGEGANSLYQSVNEGDLLFRDVSGSGTASLGRRWFLPINSGYGR